MSKVEMIIGGGGLEETGHRYKRDNYLRLGQAEGLEVPGSLGLDKAFRANHVYVTGLSGTGKSRFLESLIQQDITCWPDNQRGLLLLDPHGSVYDGVLDWIAAMPRAKRERWLGESELSRPIVPLDFHDPNHLPIYNPLRKREGVSPSVVVDNVVEAIVHAWGQSGTSDTPRLSRWLQNYLLPLYLNERPLVDAQRLKDDQVFRQQMLAAVDNASVLSSWAEITDLERKSPQRANELLESTFNRLGPIIAKDRMKRIFGPGPSFDIQAAMQKGQIVLVNLSKSDGQLSNEDARLLTAMLFADLWQSASSRGEKRDNPKPFYVYMDEFQTAISPAIAEVFDQARGYGLHMTVAHQYPSQLLGNPVGEGVFRSILANTGTKVCFRQQFPDDVDLLSRLMFSDLLDPDEVKHRLERNVAVGQEIVYMSSYNHSVTDTEGGSETFGRSITHTRSGSETTSRSETFSNQQTSTINETFANSVNHSWNNSSSENTGWNENTGRSSGVSSSRANTRGEGGSQGTTNSRTDGDGETRSESYSLRENLSSGDLRRFFTEDEPGLEGGGGRAFGLSRSKSSNATEGRSTQRSWHGGQTVTDAQNHTESASEGRSGGTSNAQGVGGGRGSTQGGGKSLATGTGQAVSVMNATSAGWSVGETESHALTSSWSSAETHGVTDAPVLLNIYSKEVISIQFRPLEEQLFLASKMLLVQEDRYFVARIKGVNIPIIGRTLDVPDHVYSGRARDAMLDGMVSRWSFLASPADLLTYELPDPVEEDEPEDFRVRQPPLQS